MTSTTRTRKTYKMKLGEYHKQAAIGDVIEVIHFKDPFAVEKISRRRLYTRNENTGAIQIFELEPWYADGDRSMNIVFAKEEAKKEFERIDREIEAAASRNHHLQFVKGQAYDEGAQFGFWNGFWTGIAIVTLVWIVAALVGF